MNKTQLKYLKEFKERLKSIGINYKIDYTVTKDKNSTPIKINVNPISSEGNDIYRKTIFAVMGMIYHFKNRNWITEYSYCYILKSCQIIKFNDGTK